MNALEAAKALAAAELVTYNHDLEMYQCGACEGLGYGREKFEHSPDCPVPMLPQIVAALEAMTLLTRDENWSYGIWSGPGAEGDIARYALGLPIEDWSKEAIERALKGEVPA